MENFALNLPFNQTSLGQCGINLAKECYRRGFEPNIFPLHQINLISHKKDDKFNEWLTNCIKKAISNHKRTTPTIRLWHLQDSNQFFSDQQILLSFYESSQPTNTELNIVKNNSKVLFSSKYAADIFRLSGADNVGSFPLGFDSESFYKKDKKYFNDDRIIFSLAGKMEFRKHTFKILNLFAKKFGNNKKYFLNCAIGNGFLDQNIQNQLIGQALEGKQYYNINFLPQMQTNEEYNDFQNCTNIDLTGLAGAEGWNLPSFQMAALGKQVIVLDETGHKDWANNNNSLLVKSNGKEDIYDNIFFRKGADYSQGQRFTWDENEVISAMEKAVLLPINSNIEGEKLREDFTWAKSLNIILENLK